MNKEQLKKERDTVRQDMYSWFSGRIDERIQGYNEEFITNMVIDFKDYSLYYTENLSVPLEMFLRKVNELIAKGFNVKQYKFFNYPVNKWLISWK